MPSTRYVSTHILCAVAQINVIKSPARANLPGITAAVKEAAVEEKALATAAKGIVPENPSEAGPLPQAAADALAAQAAVSAQAAAQAALDPHQAAADAVAMQGWIEELTVGYLHRLVWSILFGK